MKITYLTEEHMDCLASEVYARMDDDERRPWTLKPRRRWHTTCT